MSIIHKYCVVFILANLFSNYWRVLELASEYSLNQNSHQKYVFSISARTLNSRGKKFTNISEN